MHVGATLRNQRVSLNALPRVIGLQVGVSAPVSSRKATAMQRQGHDDSPISSSSNPDSSNPDSCNPELEPYNDGEDPPTHPQRGGEKDLNRYEEDEVATAPWPPPQPFQPRNRGPAIEA
jgi:hypothetical protein